jgi:hypothetical protein
MEVQNMVLFPHLYSSMQFLHLQPVSLYGTSVFLNRRSLNMVANTRRSLLGEVALLQGPAHLQVLALLQGLVPV